MASSSTYVGVQSTSRTNPCHSSRLSSAIWCDLLVDFEVSELLADSGVVPVAGDRGDEAVRVHGEDEQVRLAVGVAGGAALGPPPLFGAADVHRGDHVAPAVCAAPVHPRGQARD